MNPADISYQFFVTLDSIEQCFDFMDECYPRFSSEIDQFRIELEQVADRMFSVAADAGWKTAFALSGFAAFRHDLNDFTERVGGFMRG